MGGVAVGQIGQGGGKSSGQGQAGLDPDKGVNQPGF